MNSQLRENPARKVVKPFPKLMVSVDGLVVLFQSKRDGVLVNKDNGRSLTRLCERGNCWNHEVFEDFEGTVLLSND